jgi:ATP phosphoribosyltransferase
MTTLLNFGLPKGSLEDPTIKLFGKAGYHITKGSRSYTHVGMILILTGGLFELRK